MGILTKLIIEGLLATHLYAYREYIYPIIRAFGITFVMKKVLKGAGEDKKGDLVGLAGYSMTGSECLNYLGAELRDLNNFNENMKKPVADMIGESISKSINEGIKEGIKAGFKDSGKNIMKGVNGGVF